MANLAGSSDEEIEKQLRLGKDSHWEFKEIKFSGNKPKEPPQNDLSNELAAFANASGGVLLLGITDAGTIQGMNRAQLDATEIIVTQACTDSIKPYIAPTILRKELDNKAFLLVAVPEGESLHKSAGGYYQRVGSKKQPMNSDEQLRLAQKRGQSRFIGFDKQTMADTGLATLDEALWKPLLKARSTSQPEQALQKLNLLSEDNNNTLEQLLLGSYYVAPIPRTGYLKQK